MTAEQLKLLRGWLGAYDASLTDSGFIVAKGGKVMTVRIRLGSGNRMWVEGRKVLLFSGLFSQDALDGFVHKFWYWEKSERWVEPGLFLLGEGPEQISVAFRMLAAYLVVGGERAVLEPAYKGTAALTQVQIAQVMEDYSRKDVHGNVWMLFLDGEKLYEVCHELMEQGTYKRMFGGGEGD